MRIMFFKSHGVIVLIFLFRQIFLINGKTLPTKNLKTNDDDSQQNNPTKSYNKLNAFGPNTYAFGFEINDKASGNIQFRDERRFANDTTQGSYGYVRPDGRVMLTHFLADGKLGYLSQSQILEAGSEFIWNTSWPTSKPNKPTEKSEEQEKVNLTSILLPVKPITVQHGIDLDPPTLEKELVNPAVLEIINGETPLISDTNRQDSSIGFETINKFIPPEFPIVPFELPSEYLKINPNEDLSENFMPVLNKTNKFKSHTNNSTSSLRISEKDLTSQGNNGTKIVNKEGSHISELSKTPSNNIPKAGAVINKKNSDWYNKVINRTRQEYLETVH